MENTREKYLFSPSDRAKSVKSSGIRKAFEMANHLKDVIHLGLGEPDFEAPEELKILMKMAVDDGYSHYSSNAGFNDFRQAIANKLKKENGISYDPDTEIMATAGSMNGIHLAIHAIVNPGDEVIIQDPAFVGFEPNIIMTGGIPVKVPLREEFGFELQPEDLKNAITPKTRLMIINTPHNPTGAVISRENMEKIADLARKNRIFIISDEAYEKMVFEGAEHVSMAFLPGMKDQTLTAHSFSKSFCVCGWRIGYCAGPAELITQMVKFQQFDSVHPPAPVQKAVMHYMKRSGEFISYTRKVYMTRRDMMVERLNAIEGISCVKPGGTFYLFPNIKSLECTSEEFSAYLLEKFRVVTIPGSALGESGEGYIRICLTVPTETLKIAGERIEKAVKQFRKDKRS